MGGDKSKNGKKFSGKKDGNKDFNIPLSQTNSGMNRRVARKYATQQTEKRKPITKGAARYRSWPGKML